MTELMLEDMAVDASPEVSETDSQTFAREVRTERLAVLWRVTLLAAGLALWGILLFSTLSRFFALAWVLSMGIIMLGSLLTGVVLRRGAFKAAVWVYTFGILIGVAALLYTPPSLIRSIAPYTFVVLVVHQS